MQVVSGKIIVKLSQKKLNKDLSIDETTTHQNRIKVSVNITYFQKH